jgi:hypothetical protein
MDGPAACGPHSYIIDLNFLKLPVPYTKNALLILYLKYPHLSTETTYNETLLPPHLKIIKFKSKLMRYSRQKRK